MKSATAFTKSFMSFRLFFVYFSFWCRCFLGFRLGSLFFEVVILGRISKVFGVVFVFSFCDCFLGLVFVGGDVQRNGTF